MNRNIDKVVLNLKVGQIPVEFKYEGTVLNDLWMKQNNPVFGHALSASEVAPILNVDESDFDSNFPIQEVSTGIPFYIVPFRKLKDVKKIRVDNQKYFEFVERQVSPATSPDAENVVSSGFFVFCPEAYREANDINARMFDTYYGVPEDPATGSANGCLLGYLLKHNYFHKDALELRVEQGYEIKRPSLIKLRGKVLDGQRMDIFVGGQVHLVAKGEWFV